MARPAAVLRAEASAGIGILPGLPSAQRQQAVWQRGLAVFAAWYKVMPWNSAAVAGEPRMPPIYIAYLNRLDIEALQFTDEEILRAVEASLASQGRGETVVEPRVHLEPGVASGHFNVLRGAIKPPIDSAGVKVVGDFVDNYVLGLPSELAVLLLFDPRTGVPQAILDASGITDMRTGAMTAVGAKYLARKNSKVLGHVGSRGTAY